MNIDLKLFADPIEISIPLRFGGEQPNAYGVEPASSAACEYGDLVGDTRRDGSCNFERVSLIPHCNGTHTECVGHITHQRISVRDCLTDVIVHAVLISAEPARAAGDDLVIRRAELEAAGLVTGSGTGDALIVRTLPNEPDKRSRTYDAENIPPYFSADAMEFIVECGFRHLLVDMPSIDRLFDDGKLANHRIFWNVPAGSFEINEQTRINSSITELIYVPNEVPDGKYLLNIQIAPFESDASPSRPLLFKLPPD